MTTVFWMTLVGVATAQDGPIGVVTQPIISGTTVSVADQQSLGLVTVNGGCSGTLLNQYWVLTAHHCVSVNNMMGGPLDVPWNIRVSATWSTRMPVAARLVSYDDSHGLDVALIYLGRGDFGPAPIQPLFVGEVDTSSTLRKYGRGISAFAINSEPPMSAVDDGLYRTALFTPDEVDADSYRLPMNAAGQVGGGGDSGGPDIVEVPGGSLGIAGVQSTCWPTGYVPNQPTDVWDWVTGISDCWSEALEPIRWDIQQRIWEVPPSRIKVGVSDHTTIGEILHGSLRLEHPEAVTMRDANGDGVDDIVASVGEGLTARDLWVSLSDEHGFAEAERWQGGLCPEGQTCLLDDVNGDRMADLVAFGRSEAGEVQVSLSTGAGFEDPRPWLDRFCTGIDTCALADMNGDGLSDVVSFTNTDGGLGDGEVWVALSYGDGFVGAEPWSTDFCPEREVCTVADVTGDGRADLLSLGNPDGGGEIRVAPSTGERFEDAWTWGIAGHADERNFFADTNADGLSDLVSFAPNDAEVRVSLSVGDRFSDPEPWLSDFCTTDDICAVGDVNGDGADDVIAVTPGD